MAGSLSLVQSHSVRVHLIAVLLLGNAQVLKPERRVVFLDTDAMGGREDQKGGSPCNTAEADILMAVVAGMSGAAVALQDICLVSPYRAQVPCDSQSGHSLARVSCPLKGNFRAGL